LQLPLANVPVDRTKCSKTGIHGTPASYLGDFEEFSESRNIVNSAKCSDYRRNSKKFWMFEDSPFPNLWQVSHQSSAKLIFMVIQHTVTSLLSGSPVRISPIAIDGMGFHRHISGYSYCIRIQKERKEF